MPKRFLDQTYGNEWGFKGRHSHEKYVQICIDLLSWQKDSFKMSVWICNLEVPHSNRWFQRRLKPGWHCLGEVGYCYCLAWSRGTSRAGKRRASDSCYYCLLLLLLWLSLLLLLLLLSLSGRESFRWGWQLCERGAPYSDVIGGWCPKELDSNTFRQKDKKTKRQTSQLLIYCYR